MQHLKDGADAVETARQEMIDDLSRAWMGKSPQKDDERQPPRDLADAQRMRDEARQEYIERTVNA
jgi:hypothetical protein